MKEAASTIRKLVRKKFVVKLFALGSGILAGEPLVTHGVCAILLALP
jgi:hypothetical protein